MRAVLVALALCVVGTHAWWCTGHMIVAEIARQNLDSGIEAKVNAVMSWLSTNGPFPQSPDMVNGACWADDLKSQGLEAMEGWHFINMPYVPNNYVPPKPPQVQHDNVVNDITTLDKTAKRTDANIWIRSFAVANLIHFFGDVHQPLHATELYSAEFPDGDAGGTLFDVTFQNKTWKLHFIWDSVCGTFQAELPRPLNETSMNWIKMMAQEFQANFTVPDSERRVYNSTVMADESFAAAVAHAYEHYSFRPGAVINQTYIDTCKIVAGLRIAYAGYRLAHELNYLFKDSTSAGAFSDRLHALRPARRN